jgi:hypothetical protein
MLAHRSGEGGGKEKLAGKSNRSPYPVRIQIVTINAAAGPKIVLVANHLNVVDGSVALYPIAALAYELKRN